MFLRSPTAAPANALTRPGRDSKQRLSLSFSFEAFDWGRTPLGPRSGWSTALSTTYDIMMSNTFAMCATWGPEQTLLYNEAYATVLSTRHPWALGQPIHEVWPDVWADIAPSVQRVLAGEALRFDSQRLVMTRHVRTCPARD